MSKPVSPIPEGYHHITPYLIVSNGAKALEYYKRVFGATELYRMDGPGGTIMHAEMKIGDSPFMLADEQPEGGYRSPQAFGGTPVSLMLYVEDVDAVVDRAVKEGASLVRAVEDQFYGDRTGTIADPFGHVWTIGTHKEDVPPEEMERRLAAMSSKQ